MHEDIRRGHSEEYIADEEALSPMHFVVHEPSSSDQSSSNPSDFVPMSPRSIEGQRLEDPPSLSALTGARPRDTVLSTLSAHADEILGRAERVAREIMRIRRPRLISNETDIFPASVTSGAFTSESSAPPSPAGGFTPEHSVDVRHSMSALGGQRLSAFEPPSHTRPTSEYLDERDEEEEGDDDDDREEHDDHDHDDDDEHDEEGDESEQMEFLRPRGYPVRPYSPAATSPSASGTTPPPPLSALGPAFPPSPQR